MIKVVSSAVMPNPYPEQPDDGTWEGEGGYVGNPDHQMYFMAAMPLPGWLKDTDKLVMHPLTYGEYMYWFDRHGSPLTNFIDRFVKINR